MLGLNYGDALAPDETKNCSVLAINPRPTQNTFFMLGLSYRRCTLVTKGVLLSIYRIYSF